jgi:hypothetical protein
MDQRTYPGGQTLKARVLSVALIVLIAFNGCKKEYDSVSGNSDSEPKKEKSGLNVPPIETRPFENGYNAGMEYGKKHAKPGGSVPSESETKKVARELSNGRPDRWGRGFAQGYNDGARAVIAGQK